MRGLVIIACICFVASPARADELYDTYREAVQDAALAESSEERALTPITSGSTRVLTWTSWDGYAEGPITLERPV